jgi:hypothetical protein
MKDNGGGFLLNEGRGELYEGSPQMGILKVKKRGDPGEPLLVEMRWEDMGC